MYRSFLPGDIFAQVDRLHRELQQSFEATSPSIRGYTRGFPALNVGSTPKSVEIYAFAPGIDPARIEVNVERGVLTIEGERAPALPAAGGNNGSNGNNGNNGERARSTSHVNERFDGRFRRVISLPDDADAGRVDASYRDGVLHVSVQRRESAQPRRIEIQ